jgi:hypothetical protein
MITFALVLDVGVDVKKSDVTPEQWERRMAYEREWKARNRKRFRQQQLESQRRMYADPERRARYNAMQRRYYRENRPHKHAWRSRKGFSLETVSKLREFQDNACAICRRPFDDSNPTHKGHNDHDHETGKVRGLLCFHCNVIEGKLLKIGLSPLEFGQRLHDYLLNPPAARLTR